MKIQRIAANYQILSITPERADTPIVPAEISQLEFPTDVDLSQPIILFGQLPTWVYGALVARCLAAPWIGCFAALDGHAVVVCSRVPDVRLGDCVPVSLMRPACPAILIGGPPNSGKSVLSNAIRQTLNQAFPQHRIFLHRANWDGEGNWTHDPGSDRELILRLIRQHERRLHTHPSAPGLLTPYFDYHSRAVHHLRQIVDLVLVDLGGRIQPEKQALIANCTHSILISRDPDLVTDWQIACGQLTPIAVIHSVQAECSEVHTTQPYLQMTVGAWNQGKTRSISSALLDAIQNACSGWT